jgi:hypothetical protein
MLENLFNLIKENSTDSVINNPVIPNEKNDAVVADATHSVADGLQGVLAGGGLQSVLSLFNNNNNNSEGNGLLSNPIVSNIISSFTNKLTDNHGIASDEAAGIASRLIPSVLSSLVNRTNDPNNSNFNIGSIISSLTGGGNSQTKAGGFDIGSLISKFAGGDLHVNHDGHVGLDDIISKVSGGAQQQQTQSNAGGGLMDIINGFMKKSV